MMLYFTESVRAQTDHFADAFVHENNARGYDIVKTLWHSKVYSRLHFVQRNPVYQKQII